MTIAVCPGSFDPITLGHLDVVRRARVFADEVVVGVAANAAKSALLPVETRVALAREAVDGWDGVRVTRVPGLLAEYCASIGASLVVKGLRSGGDLDAELPMALMNRHLSGVETIFLPASPEVTHIASSMVKDIARHGGRIDDLVPPGVAEAVRAAVARTAERGQAR